MTKIEASKLARGLGHALERVVAGETLEVVRYGRVVAVISPPPKPRQSVQPDTARPVAPQVKKDPVDAVSPKAQSGVGKVTMSAAERQRHVDELLKGARRGG